MTWAAKVALLLAEARADGYVITVSNEPGLPLAMGNHTPRIEVYQAREVYAPKMFKEPGSGVWMDPRLWYAISDSGSAYFPGGYNTAYDARMAALHDPDHKLRYQDITSHHEDGEVFSSGPNVCNIVRGSALLAFWLREDPTYFEEYQK